MKGNSDQHRERIHSYCSLNNHSLHQLGQDNQEKHLENHNWEWKLKFKTVLPLGLVFQLSSFAFCVCADTLSKCHLSQRWCLSSLGKSFKCKLSFQHPPQRFLKFSFHLLKNWLSMNCILFWSKKQNQMWLRKILRFLLPFLKPFKLYSKMLFFSIKWETPRLCQEL